MTSITDKLRSRFRNEKASTPTLEERDDDKKSDHSDDGTDSRETSEEVDEKRVYEMQLSQLQEQLVAAMIENQTLDAEVKSLRDGSGVTEIRDDLESERKKNKALQEHLEYAQKSQIRGIYTRDVSDWVDVAHEATEEIPALLRGDGTPRGLVDRFNHWLLSVYFEVLADLTEDVEPTEVENKEGDQLTVKKLKDNIKRFKKDLKPVGGVAKGLHRVMTWNNPALTFIIFAIYMYAVWYGWLLPVVLFTLILKLSINYLRYRGLNINLLKIADEDDDDKDSDAFKDLGMSAKFDLVVHVARKVQNTLGQLADNLEKLKNLLMWEQPVATRRLYIILCTLFVLTCILPGTTLFTAIALIFGIRMFVIQYIYTTFPRIKQKHDGTQRMWRRLPTDAEKEQLYQKAAIDRCVLPEDGEGESRRSRRRSSGRALSDKDAEFATLFQLPTYELPLKGWKGGKRCSLIDKEKSWRSALKTGKMYLTHSFLCFERHKSLTHTHMNIIIPLADILKIGKAKPYSWIPGEGMSIEVTVVGLDKPYTFGAILNRDEVFEIIVSHGAKMHLPWATEHALEAKDTDDEKEEDSVDNSSHSPARSHETTTEKETFSPDAQNLFL